MQNWEYKKLEETCEFLDSKRKPITANKREPGPYPYYGATGILDYVKDYLFDEELILLGEDGAKWDAGDNSAFLISGKTWVNNHAHVLRPNSNVYSNWIIYFLNYSNLMKYVKGATVPKLNQENARSIEIPLPPLEEQKRIVKILDEKFAQLEIVKSNAKANLQNAKDLFQSQLTKVLNSNPSWSRKTLGETVIVERGSSPRPIEQYLTNDENGVNWVKIGDTKNVDKVIYSTKEKITQEGAKKSRFVKKGDFILSNSMSLGKPYIMGIDGYIHDGWFVLRLPEDLDTNYFFYLLSSDFVQTQFTGLAAGAIVKNISSDLVKKSVLILPPLPEQKRIVEQLDSLSQKVRSLEEIYTKQLANCDELKQAFLAKAFAGEL